MAFTAADLLDRLIEAVQGLAAEIRNGSGAESPPNQDPYVRQLIDLSPLYVHDLRWVDAVEPADSYDSFVSVVKGHRQICEELATIALPDIIIDPLVAVDDTSWTASIARTEASGGNASLTDGDVIAAHIASEVPVAFQLGLGIRQEAYLAFSHMTDDERTSSDRPRGLLALVQLFVELRRQGFGQVYVQFPTPKLQHRFCVDLPLFKPWSGLDHSQAIIADPESALASAKSMSIRDLQL